jgi:3'-phosphoadenosine 5'-phosphosulfate sulfotransferase (PAPS reductase)/FAD synthetase
MSKYAETMSIIRSVRKHTGTAVLFYSAGGKDSIALLDMLAKEFEHVICYYMYLIPCLDHVQPYISWAATHYRNVEVRQIEHFQMDYFKKGGYFCDADPRYKLPKINPNALRVRKIGDIEQWVREQTGIKFAFSGMKGVDGYMKRMRLKRFAHTGYITEKGMVYPLAEWTNKEVLQYISAKNLIKPFVYGNGVSQGFTITLDVLTLLKAYYPKDYRRTLEVFPYAETLIFDYERKLKTESKKTE